MELVYVMLVVLFVISFGVPIALWTYRVFVARVVRHTTDKLKDVARRVSERVSDAGKRIQEKASGA